MGKAAMKGPFAAALVLLAVVGLCSGCDGSAQADTTPLCRALGSDVPGLYEIAWGNGVTTQEATWATLLDAGILHGDRATLRAAAAVLHRGDDGFTKVLNAAPADLRPALERLRALLRDPAEVLARRRAPAVMADVRAVTNATPPELCGWMR